MNIYFILSLIISYLIGSIPTGYWFCKIFFNIDITNLGSGNIGATNVSRVLGNKKYFVLIFLLDFAKAFFALYILGKLFCFSDLELYCLAGSIILGNAYSIFLKFGGGKGVAATFGILTFFMPILAIFAGILWLLLLFLFKKAYISSLFSSYFIIFIFFKYLSQNNQNLLIFLIILSFWITFRHKSNIFNDK